ncbi:MAG: DUF1858 domain-containing protein [Sneathiellaceae bacterium]
MTIEAHMPVDEVMTARPATIRVFLAWQLHCVGCPARRLHTVDDACSAHGIDPDAFLAALSEAALDG